MDANFKQFYVGGLKIDEDLEAVSLALQGGVFDLVMLIFRRQINLCTL